MNIWGNGHLGANGHFGTDELWSKWALGANGQFGANRYLGHWGHVGTRTNRHLKKRALWTDGRWGKWEQMGIRKNDINKWALGAYEHQRNVRANGHFAIDVYGYRGLMSTWRKGAPGQLALGEVSIAGKLTLWGK